MYVVISFLKVYKTNRSGVHHTFAALSYNSDLKVVINFCGFTLVLAGIKSKLLNHPIGIAVPNR